MLTSAFSLIPQHLYQEENADLWLNFLRPHIPRNQRIVALPFPKLQLVCVFEDGITRHTHAIPFLLHASIEAIGSNTTTALFALRQEDRLAIICLKEGELQLANIYEADTKEQALHWILKIYDQYNLSHQTPLYILCGDTTFRLLNAHIPTYPLAHSTEIESCE